METLKEPWNFCETPEEKCTMNYCDENGCEKSTLEQQIEKLEAEKKELLDALERVIIVQDKYFGEQEIHGRLRALCVEIESIIQKHKQ